MLKSGLPGNVLQAIPLVGAHRTTRLDIEDMIRSRPRDRSTLLLWDRQPVPAQCHTVPATQCLLAQQPR